MGSLVQTVPRARIESVRPPGKSLMDEPSQFGLTPETFPDIATYLKGL